MTFRRWLVILVSRLRGGRLISLSVGTPLVRDHVTPEEYFTAKLDIILSPPLAQRFTEKWDHRGNLLCFIERYNMVTDVR